LRRGREITEDGEGFWFVAERRGRQGRQGRQVMQRVNGEKRQSRTMRAREEKVKGDEESSRAEGKGRIITQRQIENFCQEQTQSGVPRQSDARSSILLVLFRLLCFPTVYTGIERDPIPEY
jgi:hypothetical protein